MTTKNVNLTVKQLRDLLNRAVNDGLGDRELRFAYQANAPLQDVVAGVWYEDDDEDVQEEADTNVFYLVSGGQDAETPYAPCVVFEECNTKL